MSTQYPLQDGQVIETRNGKETIMGEIRNPPQSESVCWSLQGNWYRRRDGKEMTGWNGEVMTVEEFYKRQRNGEL